MLSTDRTGMMHLCDDNASVTFCRRTIDQRWIIDLLPLKKEAIDCKECLRVMNERNSVDGEKRIRFPWEVDIELAQVSNALEEVTKRYQASELYSARLRVTARQFLHFIDGDDMNSKAYTDTLNKLRKLLDE